ncbi:hypothetical protein [Amycolatopsis sp. NPDC004378]
MSGIYFHTVDRPQPLALDGGERARIDGLVRDTFREVLRRPSMAGLRQALRLTGAAPVPGFDPDKLRLLGFVFGGEEVLEQVGPGGEVEQISLVGLMANTAVAAVPALQAPVWLHFGCEAHGWVDGPDRAWLADRYADAVEAGIARDTPRWDAVIALLRESATEPVVTSFYNDFPNQHLVVSAGVWPKNADLAAASDVAAEVELERRWEALSDRQRWDLGMGALRANPAGAGEIQWSPAVFAANGIAHEHDAEQLVRAGAQLRLVPAPHPA